MAADTIYLCVAIADRKLLKPSKLMTCDWLIIIQAIARFDPVYPVGRYDSGGVKALTLRPLWFC